MTPREKFEVKVRHSDSGPLSLEKKCLPLEIITKVLQKRRQTSLTPKRNGMEKRYTTV